MKNLFKLFAISTFAFAMLMSCNSNSGNLKKEAKTITKLTEKVNSVQDPNDLKVIGDKFQKCIGSIPAEIRALPDEELLKLEGAEELIKATEQFEEAFAAASERMMLKALGEASDILKELSDDEDDEDDEKDEYEE